ncbi:hypothetical protein HPG69_013651 [Diceros bicornis minor]|uniref:N-terminal Ras-GEF domain-containing protein n=1 Tax=Diceros bicornis minor TaxID=77932 RepID=A0A7J7FLF1_DICBM|nr:hypothetical protein HPG69_013651 [Diceros bicornis minor]
MPNTANRVQCWLRNFFLLWALMSHLLPQVTEGLGVRSELQPPTLLLPMVLPLTTCPSSVPPQGENPSIVNKDETHTVWTVQAGMLEKLVEHLVPTFLGSDTTYIHTFLCTYRTLATTLQVLDLLYGYILPYSSEDGGPLDQVKRTVSSILGTWLDQYSEDYFQPLEFSCLKMLLAYMQLNVPGSDLKRHAHLLLAQLEHPESTEAETEGEEDVEWVVGMCGGDGAGTTMNKTSRGWVWKDFLGVGSWTETSLIGKRGFMSLQGTWKAVILMTFSLLGATAPAPEQNQEPPEELMPAPTVVPATAPEGEQTHAIAPVQA